MLFEIWIVDASIFQARSHPSAHGVCAPCVCAVCVHCVVVVGCVGLIVCCGMPAL